MQGLKHSQKVKIPQKEEEETKFPLAFHAEDKNGVYNKKLVGMLTKQFFFQNDSKTIILMYIKINVYKEIKQLIS